jgi:hypothetical protein
MFCGYTVFPGRDRFIRRYGIREDETGERLSDAIGVVFVELTKLRAAMKKPVSETTPAEARKFRRRNIMQISLIFTHSFPPRGASGRREREARAAGRIDDRITGMHRRAGKNRRPAGRLIAPERPPEMLT